MSELLKLSHELNINIHSNINNHFTIIYNLICNPICIILLKNSILVFKLSFNKLLLY